VAAQFSRSTPMESFRHIINRFDGHLSLRTAILAMAAAAPMSAQADDWSGFPTLVLGLVLIPGAAIALLFISLAFVRNLNGAIYVAATALFLPVAWYGFRFFAGATVLASEGPGLIHFAAMVVLASCVVAYGVITFRYWRRYIFIGPSQE
jgi:hypothetical protein